MLSKSFRSILSGGVIIVLFILAACSANSPANTSIDQTYAGLKAPAALSTGTLYDQPVNPGGKLLLSAWLDPDGSDSDEYVWDDFTLQSNESVTDITWYGAYDPSRFAYGKPVIDFRIRIFPSTPFGTEPAVAGPPLIDYLTNGNAGETAIGTVGNGATLYAYTSSLPLNKPFLASAGVKYWLQIEAYQHGTIPDWCWASGMGGNNSHYWYGNLGGMFKYLAFSGDAAFTLLGPVPDTPTPTDTPTDLPTDTPTDTPTDLPTATDTPTDTPTATDTVTSTASSTPTFAPTFTIVPTSTYTFTATNTAVDTPTPTHTPTFTATFVNPTNTFTSTPTDTATQPAPATATYTSTNTATSIPSSNTPTPTPLSNVPGKVTGGGNVGTSTFGFVVKYGAGDANPSGNLTYVDHANKLNLKAISFTLLFINGNHAQVTGYATVNSDPNLFFVLDVYDYGEPGNADIFALQIPGMNGYSSGGVIHGGKIQISTP